MELFSEGQDARLASDNIVVAVRVRPLSQDEILQGETNTVRVGEDGRAMSVVEPGLGGHNMIRNFQVLVYSLHIELVTERVALIIGGGAQKELCAPQNASFHL